MKICDKCLKIEIENDRDICEDCILDNYEKAGIMVVIINEDSHKKFELIRMAWKKQTEEFLENIKLILEEKGTEKK